MAFIIKEFENDIAIRDVKIETKDLRAAKINASRLKCDSRNIIEISTVKGLVVARKAMGLWIDCVHTEWMVK